MFHNCNSFFFFLFNCRVEKAIADTMLSWSNILIVERVHWAPAQLADKNREKQMHFYLYLFFLLIHTAVSWYPGNFLRYEVFISSL